MSIGVSGSADGAGGPGGPDAGGSSGPGTHQVRGSDSGEVSARGTSAVLVAGTLASAACFLVALGLEVMGRPTAQGDALDFATVVGAALEPRPWGWATLGVMCVIATPAAALLATLLEYRRHREWLLAAAVLGILALSLVIALVR